MGQLSLAPAGDGKPVLIRTELSLSLVDALSRSAFDQHRGYEWKERDLPFRVEAPTLYRVTASGRNSDTVSPVSIVGHESTMTRGNPRRAQIARLRRLSEESGKYKGNVEALTRTDVGGEFVNIKHQYWDNSPRLSFTIPGNLSTRSYEGPQFAVSSSVGPNSTRWPSVPLLALQEEMREKGTTAIARTAPTNPVADVGVLLGELYKEGLPSMIGAQLGSGKKGALNRAGSEYLNYQFGVAPLLSSIQDFASTVRQSNRLIEQLEKNAGRLVRRRYDFPDDVSNEIIDSSSTGVASPSLNVVHLDGTQYANAYIVRREVHKSMWFSGAFTYHYAAGHRAVDSFRRAEQRFNRLFGLRITPSLLWELAPWSWALDWKTNMGDVLSNISAFSNDGLVLRWGYVMCHYTVTDTHERTVRYAPNTGLGTRTWVQKFTTEVKLRKRATPYGFGLDPDWKDFSAFQLSILAALGMTRGR